MIWEKGAGIGEGLDGWCCRRRVVTDRLGGSWLLRRLLRAIGLNLWMCSSDGPGTWREDSGTTSSDNSVMPLNVDALRVVCRH